MGRVFVLCRTEGSWSGGTQVRVLQLLDSPPFPEEYRKKGWTQDRWERENPAMAHVRPLVEGAESFWVNADTQLVRRRARS